MFREDLFFIKKFLQIMLFFLEGKRQKSNTVHGGEFNRQYIQYLFSHNAMSD